MKKILSILGTASMAITSSASIMAMSQNNIMPNENISYQTNPIFLKDEFGSSFYFHTFTQPDQFYLEFTSTLDRILTSLIATNVLAVESADLCFVDSDGIKQISLKNDAFYPSDKMAMTNFINGLLDNGSFAKLGNGEIETSGVINSLEKEKITLVPSISMEYGYVDQDNMAKTSRLEMVSLDIANRVPLNGEFTLQFDLEI